MQNSGERKCTKNEKEREKENKPHHFSQTKQFSLSSLKNCLHCHQWQLDHGAAAVISPRHCSSSTDLVVLFDIFLFPHRKQIMKS
jgi:hypothetical protein